MGQSVFKDLPVEFAKEAQTVKEWAVLTHEEFMDMIKEVNSIFENFMDGNEKKLIFAIKEDTCDTVFWKGTVSVICYRRLSSGAIEDQSEMNLKQFLHAHKMIVHQVKPLLETQDKCIHSELQASAMSLCRRNELSASMIMKTLVESSDSDMEECCICMENTPEVTLPCAHSYCLFCIEQWNVSNKTCPVCRESLESTKETWVLPEIPNSSEVDDELQKTLSGLTLKSHNQS